MALLPEHRCQDCGKRFRAPWPKRHELVLCPACKRLEQQTAQPNVDPTKERSGDYFTFRQHGRGIPLFKDR